MPLAADLATVQGRHQQPQAIDVLLTQLDPEDRDALLTALHGYMASAEIARKLVKNGYLTELKDPAQRVREWRNRQR
jgi:hypothetical protein